MIEIWVKFLFFLIKGVIKLRDIWFIFKISLFILSYFDLYSLWIFNYLCYWYLWKHFIYLLRSTRKYSKVLNTMISVLKLYYTWSRLLNQNRSSQDIVSTPFPSAVLSRSSLFLFTNVKTISACLSCRWLCSVTAS
jgi:hypothetical protein